MNISILISIYIVEDNISPHVVGRVSFCVRTPKDVSKSSSSILPIMLALSLRVLLCPERRRAGASCTTRTIVIQEGEEKEKGTRKGHWAQRAWGLALRGLKTIEHAEPEGGGGGVFAEMEIFSPLLRDACSK